MSGFLLPAKRSLGPALPRKGPGWYPSRPKTETPSYAPPRLSEEMELAIIYCRTFVALVEVESGLERFRVDAFRAELELDAVQLFDVDLAELYQELHPKGPPPDRLDWLDRQDQSLSEEEGRPVRGRYLAGRPPPAYPSWDR